MILAKAIKPKSETWLPKWVLFIWTKVLESDKRFVFVVLFSCSALYSSD